jgi:hypothetical protein
VRPSEYAEKSLDDAATKIKIGKSAVDGFAEELKKLLGPKEEKSTAMAEMKSKPDDPQKPKDGFAKSSLEEKQKGELAHAGSF